MAMKVRTNALPPHPIEATPAYKNYVTRTFITNKGTLVRAMTRFLREMTPAPLRDITPLHVEQVLQRLTVQGYEKSYIEKLYRRIAGFFGWCRDMGYIDTNPTQMVRPQIPDALFIPVVIPDIDVEAIHRFVMGRAVVEEIILWGALRMGCRLSEICMATVEDALRDRSVQDFLVDPRVVLKTKTTPRLAKQPRFALPAYKALLTAKQNTPQAPLLYLAGVPIKDRKGNPNIEARCLVARSWFKLVQEQSVGEYRYTPKATRSNFITKELQNDPNKLLAVAAQCGNSVKVIQKNYFNYLNTPEFESAEND